MVDESSVPNVSCYHPFRVQDFGCSPFLQIVPKVWIFVFVFVVDIVADEVKSHTAVSLSWGKRDGNVIAQLTALRVQVLARFAERVFASAGLALLRRNSACVGARIVVVVDAIFDWLSELVERQEGGYGRQNRFCFPPEQEPPQGRCRCEAVRLLTSRTPAA